MTTLAVAARAAGAGLSALEALPDAVLVDILLHLRADERLRAQLVSKRLRALVLDPRAGLWRTVSFEGARARAQRLRHVLTPRIAAQACRSGDA